MSITENSHPQFPWLSEVAGQYVEQPEWDRFEFIRGRHFVRHTQMKTALDAMSFITSQPRRRRMHCVFISGPSGSGKTTLVERFLKDQGIEAGSDNFHVMVRHDKAKVLTADLSGIKNEQDFYTKIGNACVNNNSRLKYSNDATIRILADLRVSVIILDEADRLCELPKKDQLEIISQMKYMTNNAQIGIIALGTRKLEHFIVSEDTLKQRFMPDVVLSPLLAQDEFRGFVNGMARKMPLKNAPKIDMPRCLNWLSERTNRIQPRIVATLQAAAMHGIKTGVECLNYEMLKLAEKHPFIHARMSAADDE